MPRANKPHPPSEGSRILTRLLRTRAAANREDTLGDPSAAAAWLAGHGLASSDVEVTEADRRRLLDLREGLYALIVSRGRGWTEDAAQSLNQVIQEAPLRVSVAADRTLRFASPDPAFDGAFGEIVRLMVDSYFAGEWKRLKACANDECLQVFYDDSRTGNRKWCDERCGDRIRTRGYRRAKRHGLVSRRVARMTRPRRTL